MASMIAWWRSSAMKGVLAGRRSAVEAVGEAEQLLQVRDDHVGAGLAQVLGRAEVAGDADQKVEVRLAAGLDARRGDVDEDRVAGVHPELLDRLGQRAGVAGAGDDRVEEVGNPGQLERRA